MWLIILFLVGVYFLVDWLLRLPKVGNFSNKYVFITGCDSGFGKELAVRLDKLGFPVFAACLSPEGKRLMQETCSSRVVPLSLDVSDKTSIQEAFQTVNRQLPDQKSLWAVVNNAGTSGNLTVTEMLSQEDFLSACAVNLFGPIEVSRVFMPLLRKSQGRLVLMTSIMGRCPATPAPYSVTKHGLEAFGDVVRREVSPFGVKVSIIEPGYFLTNVISLDRTQVQVKASYQQADPDVQAAYGQDLVETLVATLRGARAGSSRDTYKVLDAYESAISSRWPRARYVVGHDATFIYRTLSWLPEWLFDWIVTRENNKLAQKFRQTAD